MVAFRGDLTDPEVWRVLRCNPGVDRAKVFLCHAPRLVRLWAIETCPGGQAVVRPGRLQGSQLAGLASSHDPVHGHVLLRAAGQVGIKKQPDLTLYQVVEALDAVLALFRYLRRDGRRRS